MSNKKKENVMSSKKKAIAWIAVLVMLIGSSYFIYNYVLDTDAIVSDMFFRDKTGAEENTTGTDSNKDVDADRNEDVDANKDVDRNEDANAYTNQGSGTNEEENPNKIMSIDFTLKDFDGNEVSLSDYRGKMVILNFWASWCPPCKTEMPDFDSVNRELTEDDDVVILTVNLTNGYRGETEKVAKEFINKNGYTFPVLLDTEGIAAQIYGISSIPTTYFIDKEGYVVDGISGMVNKDFILRAIETYK